MSGSSAVRGLRGVIGFGAAELAEALPSAGRRDGGAEGSRVPGVPAAWGETCAAPSAGRRTLSPGLVASGESGKLCCVPAAKALLPFIVRATGGVGTALVNGFAIGLGAGFAALAAPGFGFCKGGKLGFCVDEVWPAFGAADAFCLCIAATVLGSGGGVAVDLWRGAGLLPDAAAFVPIGCGFEGVVVVEALAARVPDAAGVGLAAGEFGVRSGEAAGRSAFFGG